MWLYIVIGICVALAILICFCLAIASFAFDNYKDKLNEADNFSTSTGMNTLEFVEDINNKHFGGKIRIENCQEYEDHYSVGTVALSQQTISSSSLASFSIIAHELGHALQDKKGRSLRKHWKNKRIGRQIGMLFLPFAIIGAVLSILHITTVLPQVLYLYLGLIFFGVSAFIFLFALFLKWKEIKIEKEASKYAVDFLKEYLTPPEVKLCTEFLNSARLTYWASLFKTMLGWTLLTSKGKKFYFLQM